jgi:hypothetical protein
LWALFLGFAPQETLNSKPQSTVEPVCIALVLVLFLFCSVLSLSLSLSLSLYKVFCFALTNKRRIFLTIMASTAAVPCDDAVLAGANDFEKLENLSLRVR